MSSRAYPSLHLPLLIAGIGAVMLAAAATTAPRASIQPADKGLSSAVASADSPGALAPPLTTAPANAALERRAKARCDECGVIESMWEIDADSRKSGADSGGGHAAGNQHKWKNSPTRTYETLVRLQDGSTFIIGDVNPATRRPGERVKLIRGTE